MENTIKQIKEIIIQLQTNDTKVLLGGNFVLKEVYQLVDKYEDIDIFVYPKSNSDRAYFSDVIYRIAENSNVIEFNPSHSYQNANSSFKITYKDSTIFNIILKTVLDKPTPIQDNIKYHDISIVPLMYILRAKQCYNREKDNEGLFRMAMKIANPELVIKFKENEF